MENSAIKFKYPFVKNYLSRKLVQENLELKYWKSLLTNSDNLLRRQAEGNIPNTEHRINELEEVIEHLKKII